MRVALIALLGSSLLTGCIKKDDSSEDSAASAVDSSDGVSAEGNTMMAAVDGSDMASLGAVTSEQVTAAIVANVALRWTPSTCATVTSSGSNITIKYNDCTGPRGLVHVTGELDLAVSVSLAGVISVHGTATNLQVNNAVLTIDADATYEVSGTDHTLTVMTMGSGTGPRGNAIEHDGNYTVTWDTTSQCGSIDGTWSTEIGSADRGNDVNLSKCAGSCPTGTVTHNFLAGASVTVTFDGSDIATWSASTGASGSVTLTCN